MSIILVTPRQDAWVNVRVFMGFGLVVSYYSVPETLTSDTGRVSIRVGWEPRQPIFVRILLFVGFQLINLNE